MPSAAQTKPVAAPACPMDEPPAPTSIAIPVSAATPPAPQPTHPHSRPRRKPEDCDSEVPDVGASCDTATPKAPAIANRVSADPMPSASTLWTVRVLSPAAFAKCSCDQDFASRRVRTIAESIFICASMSFFQAWRLCLNQLGSRSPSTPRHSPDKGPPRARHCRLTPSRSQKRNVADPRSVFPGIHASEESHPESRTWRFLPSQHIGKASDKNLKDEAVCHTGTETGR